MRECWSFQNKDPVKSLGVIFLSRIFATKMDKSRIFLIPNHSASGDTSEPFDMKPYMSPFLSVHPEALRDDHPEEWLTPLFVKDSCEHVYPSRVFLSKDKDYHILPFPLCATAINLLALWSYGAPARSP